MVDDKVKESCTSTRTMELEPAVRAQGAHERKGDDIRLIHSSITYTVNSLTKTRLMTVEAARRCASGRKTNSRTCDLFLCRPAFVVLCRLSTMSRVHAPLGALSAFPCLFHMTARPLSAVGAGRMTDTRSWNRMPVFIFLFVRQRRQACDVSCPYVMPSCRA